MKEKDSLNLNIDLPNVQIHLKTTNPLPALMEIRRVLEGLHISEDVIYEEFVTEELKMAFSKQFLQNQNVMEAIRALLKQEEDYRVATARISGKTTVDLESNHRYVEIDRQEVKRAITELVDFDTCCVKKGIVHVNGAVDHDGKLLIADYIHKYMPTAQLRAFHSPSQHDNVTVECIFFGDFPDEE